MSKRKIKGAIVFDYSETEEQKKIRMAKFLNLLNEWKKREG